MHDEYKVPEVIFKYYLPENQEEVQMHLDAHKMYSALNHIDNLCRSIVKYEANPNETKIQFAQILRDTIREYIQM